MYQFVVPRFKNTQQHVIIVMYVSEVHVQNTIRQAKHISSTCSYNTNAILVVAEIRSLNFFPIPDPAHENTNALYVEPDEQREGLLLPPGTLEGDLSHKRPVQPDGENLHQALPFQV